jgi:phosphoribosyl 1,2-cyclic phosphodiesterase
VELIVLGSGSAGNTAVVRTGGTTILVDAGLSARKTLHRLALAGVDPAEIVAVLLTHEHGDHAGGLPVLLQSLRCPVFATRLTADGVRDSHPRCAEAQWKIFATGSGFGIGDLTVQAFSVPHDAADPVGFTFRASGRSLAVVTDLGHVNQSVAHHIAGVECLFVEANHDEALLQADTRRPFSTKQRILSAHGHLSNRAAADLVRQCAGPSLRRVVLGHLSRDCNEPSLAMAAVAAALDGRTDIEICCALQDEILVGPGHQAAPATSR